MMKKLVNRRNAKLVDRAKAVAVETLRKHKEGIDEIVMAFMKGDIDQETMEKAYEGLWTLKLRNLKGQFRKVQKILSKEELVEIFGEDIVEALTEESES